MSLETIYVIVSVILPTVALFSGIYYLLRFLKKPIEDLDQS